MEPNLWQHRIVVRLFRIWTMAREDGEPTLARMHETCTEFGLPDHATVSCSSLFALVESAVGRRLVRGAPCGPAYTPDEQALLGVLKAAPTLGSMRGSEQVPHGLPGAIRWAAMCVRDAVRWPADDMASDHSGRTRPRTCPFAAARELRLAP